MDTPETRLGEWEEFSKLVYSHIRDYTIKQYGCKGEDNVSEWSIKDLMEAIYKYYKRYKTNMRPGQEQMDLMKIAHYACMAYWKREEGSQEEPKESVIFSGYPHELGFYWDTGGFSDNLSEKMDDDQKEYEIVVRKK